jgi:selenocysteine-specific elongation factor
VDRVFSKKGFGSVVTGTVLSGKTKIGSDLEIIPGNQKAKVRGIQTHGTETSSVKMGDRAAINLAGTDLNELYRGTVIADPYWVNSTKKLIAHVTLIEDTRWKLKNRQRVHLHLGTAEVVARAMMQDPLEAGQSGNALFYLEKPIAALMDERFIIRSLSPMETIGGCVVLDSNPMPIRKELKLWTASLQESSSERFKQFVSQYWKSPKSLGNWARHFQTTESQVKSWIKSEEIKNEKGFLFTSEKRDESMEYIREVLTQFHKDNPYKKSLSQDRLKDATHFSTNWLSYILDYMGDELINVEGGFALKSHSVVLSDSDASLAKILEDSVKQAGYAILNAKELSSENPKITLEILYILKGEGKIIEVGRGLWIHGDVLDKLKDDLCLFFTANPQLNVSDFKTITNTTRKSAIPLLEYCDKHGLTERVGNSRIKGENCG